jgi:GT2 family glycosyltransferase
VKLISWLADDDLIESDSLLNALKVFNSNDSVVAVYGACRYITNEHKTLFINKSGRWAVDFMNFLPNLIPQPGSLIKRSSFEKIGGLKSKYPLSFDFEMFFNLRKIGKLKYIPNIQGSFRWHSDSMSVEQRRSAVMQTSKIRRNNLPIFLRTVSMLWEVWIISITLLIGVALSRKLKTY